MSLEIFFSYAKKEKKKLVILMHRIVKLLNLLRKNLPNFKWHHELCFSCLYNIFKNVTWPKSVVDDMIKWHISHIQWHDVIKWKHYISLTMGPTKYTWCADAVLNHGIFVLDLCKSFQWTFSKTEDYTVKKWFFCL